MSKARKISPVEQWLGQSETPIFVLDAARHLRVFNAGCEALTGWPAAEVLGLVCQYASQADEAGTAALTSSLCPPPEAFAGQELSVPVQVPHRAGHTQARLVHYVPLYDPTGVPAGLLGVILPWRPPTARPPIPAARQLHADLSALRVTLRARFGTQSIVAGSLEMGRVLTQLELAQQTTACVLLQGEEGTGKEHLARVIHFGGLGKANWFVPLDCRRLAAEDLQRVWQRLVEVHRRRPGGTGPGPQPGTVYLADIEFLPRDLQEQIVRAFADDNEAPLPLRLLTATGLERNELARDERLRPDFVSLVSTLTIEIPPLRDRHDDIPVLAQHFLEECNRQGDKQAGGFDDEIWPLFYRYRWPGNLDELAAVVQEAHRGGSDLLIQAKDLPFRFRTGLESQELAPPAEPPPMLLDPLLTKVETQLITLALERSRYNKSKAAEFLGVNRARLYRRMEQLGIEDQESPGSRSQ